MDYIKLTHTLICFGLSVFFIFFHLLLMLVFTLFVQVGWLCRGSIDLWGQERRFHYQYWTSEKQYEALLLYILANRWHYEAVYKKNTFFTTSFKANFLLRSFEFTYNDTSNLFGKIYLYVSACLLSRIPIVTCQRISFYLSKAFKNIFLKKTA